MRPRAGRAHTGGWLALCAATAGALQAHDRAASDASSANLADELGRLGALKFDTRLQDAADENVFSDVAVVVRISDVAADSQQCQISYRQRVEQEQDGGDEQRRLRLDDIDDVKVEPFESFENEHQGKAGWVYTMTHPEVSAVVVTHRSGALDWFAVIGVEAGRRLADDIKRRGDYCLRRSKS